MISRRVVLSLCLCFALACLGATGCAPATSSDAPAFSGGGGAPPSTTTPTEDAPALDAAIPPSTTAPVSDIPPAAGD